MNGIRLNACKLVEGLVNGRPILYRHELDLPPLIVRQRPNLERGCRFVRVQRGELVTDRWESEVDRFGPGLNLDDRPSLRASRRQVAPSQSLFRSTDPTSSRRLRPATTATTTATRVSTTVHFHQPPKLWANCERSASSSWFRPWA